MQRGTGPVPLRKSLLHRGTLCFFTRSRKGGIYLSSLPAAPAAPHLKLCWRRLAAAEAGVAAPGAAGMPVRWPRRPATVSEAVVAGAGPDFSCAAGQKRAAKPPNRRGKVSLGGLCVCQWVCR